jgi:hypothetical protein
MSPLSYPEPCPNLIIEEINEKKYHFCKIYKNRPEQCENHSFPMRFCPIGMSIFKFDNPTDIQVHLEIGYLKIKEIEDKL